MTICWSALPDDGLIMASWSSVSDVAFVAVAGAGAAALMCGQPCCCSGLATGVRRTGSVVQRQVTQISRYGLITRSACSADLTFVDTASASSSMAGGTEDRADRRELRGSLRTPLVVLLCLLLVRSRKERVLRLGVVCSCR